MDEKFRGMPAEEIYDLLLKEQKNQKCSGNCQSGDGDGDPGDGECNCHSKATPGFEGLGDGKGCADHDDVDGDAANDDGSEARNYSEKEWKENMATALEAARQAGKLPAGVKRYIEGLLQPKISWLNYLETAAVSIESDLKEQTTWNRPSMRGVAGGYRLPSTYGEMFNPSVAADTSGSMTAELLIRCITEIKGMFDVGAQDIDFYACDAAIHDEMTLSNIDDIEVGGGGGTDFRPVFDRIRDKTERECSMLIYFTDTYGNYPEEPPNYPVFWCVPEELEGQHSEPPFGTVVYMPV
jgi:predicted metal-dependent peptidase